ncbi:hypothetical protein [Haloarcula amylolytica]|uniref:Uncharacterized protein n=1 Tax=Haloarcula amylolytica JCM 13557 TaxID=1227452 RepID=M0K7H2_9EURY|nr:hypothetical protein [Haloarcula amylolytica]EMA17151.1 hypothetical protein C442_17815 [Haloarcula amylolytica JCM 13557]
MAVADCQDCSWSETAQDLVSASDEAERHERKERHDVEVKRVATDGGVSRRDAIATTAQLTGVGDQDTTCQHGVVGCPGPEGDWLDSCVECFFEGGDDDV